LLHGEIAAFVAVSPFEFTWENRPTSSFDLFKQYLQKMDTDIKCKALRAMSGMFFAHPRVMLGSSTKDYVQQCSSYTPAGIVAMPAGDFSH
jgi:hypothetical protein